MAKKRVIDLPVASVLAPTDILHVVQTILDKQITLAALDSYLSRTSDKAPKLIRLTGDYTVPVDAAHDYVLCYDKLDGTPLTVTFPALNETSPLPIRVSVIGDPTKLALSGVTSISGMNVQSFMGRYTKSGSPEYNWVQDTLPADLLTALKTVDGTGSGLDADLLDGQEGIFFQNSSNQNAGTLPAERLPGFTGDATAAAGSNALAIAASLILDKLKTVDGTGSGLDTDLVRSTTPGARGLNYLASANVATIAALILSDIKTVDGAGSGLDADLFSGRSINDFASPKTLAANTDINTLVNAGVYVAQGTSHANNPFTNGDTWILVVNRVDANMVTHLAFSVSPASQMRSRVNYYGWSAWQNVFTSAGFQPIYVQSLGSNATLTTTPIGTMISMSSTGSYTLTFPTGIFAFIGGSTGSVRCALYNGGQSTSMTNGEHAFIVRRA